MLVRNLNARATIYMSPPKAGQIRRFSDDTEPRARDLRRGTRTEDLSEGTRKFVTTGLAILVVQGGLINEGTEGRPVMRI